MRSRLLSLLPWLFFLQLSVLIRETPFHAQNDLGCGSNVDFVDVCRFIWVELIRVVVLTRCSSSHLQSHQWRWVVALGFFPFSATCSCLPSSRQCMRIQLHLLDQINVVEMFEFSLSWNVSAARRKWCLPSVSGNLDLVKGTLR